MPVSVLQTELQSLASSFVSRYAQLHPAVIRREPGSQKDEIALYIDMARRDPVIRFCMELVFLYCYSLLGEYTHPRSRVQKFGRDAIANCKGSWSVTIKNIMTAAWYGYSWTEVAIAEVTNNRKTIARLRTLNPSRYNFFGTEKGIEEVHYTGTSSGSRSGVIELDYNTGIHIVCGTDLSFDENHGSGRLEAAYAYWDLHQLLMPVIAVASQRQATPILVQKTETGSMVTLLDGDGHPILDANGAPVMIPKGIDAVRQLAELGSAGVTAIDPDDEIYAINQKVAGDFLLNVIQLCEQHRLMAALVPTTLISASNSGVGDSGLSERHMRIFEAVNVGTVQYISEEVIDQLFRPLIIYNFGEIGEYGNFPIQRSDPSANEVARIVIDAIARGSFLRCDLEAANCLRSKLGLGMLSQQEFDFLRQVDRSEAAEAASIAQGGQPSQPGQPDQPSQPDETSHTEADQVDQSSQAARNS